MRRLTVTILLVFGLFGSGCTSIVQSNVVAPIVSEGERSAAMSQLLDCQLAAARKFDVGKSQSKGSFIGMGSLDAARESLKSRQFSLSIP